MTPAQLLDDLPVPIMTTQPLVEPEPNRPVPPPAITPLLPGQGEGRTDPNGVSTPPGERENPVTEPDPGNAGSGPQPDPAPPDKNPPVAQAQILGTPLNTALPVTLAATDADNDKLTYSVVTAPAHGRLEGSPPNLSYIPQDGYAGFDSLTFRADSGRPQGQSTPAAVRIWVVDERDLSGRTATGHVVPGDSDIWTFEGVAGQRVLLKLAGTWPGMAVYPPGGVQPEVTGKRVDWQLQKTGQYTIVVQGGSFADNYSLTLLIINGQHASLGDLDGGAIANGETLYGSASPTGDLDAFTFYGEAGKHVITSFAGTWPGVLLYGPGEVGVVASGKRIDLQLTTSGRYTIVVEAGSFNDGYTLTLQQF